jgi:DNA polymerase-3 subunit epsilon
MRRIGETEFVAIDFESAGVARGSTDEPVQIAWAVMRGLEITPEAGFVSYLRTDRPITWAAQRVHGITVAHLAGAPSLQELWPRVREGLGGRVLVAHGMGTEKRFLRAFPLHGFGPWVDTLVLARRFFPSLRDFSLGAVCDMLGLSPAVQALVPGGRWHDAGYDATASLALLRHIVLEAGWRDEPIERLG